MAGLFLLKKMSIAQFTIQLTRNASHENDDVITIAPTGMGDYRIDFRSKPEGTHHFIYHEGEDVMRYVEDLFYLLPTDAMPFTHMQFNFPCFPSVIYKMADADTNVVRHTVKDRLRSLLDNWPEKRVRLGLLSGSG